MRESDGDRIKRRRKKTKKRIKERDVRFKRAAKGKWKPHSHRS